MGTADASEAVGLLVGNLPHEVSNLWTCLDALQIGAENSLVAQIPLRLPEDGVFRTDAVSAHDGAGVVALSENLVGGRARGRVIAQGVPHGLSRIVIGNRDCGFDQGIHARLAHISHRDGHLGGRPGRTRFEVTRGNHFGILIRRCQSGAGQTTEFLLRGLHCLDNFARHLTGHNFPVGGCSAGAVVKRIGQRRRRHVRRVGADGAGAKAERDDGGCGQSYSETFRQCAPSHSYRRCK